MITQTKTVHNLSIFKARRRPDGLVVLSFAILRPGVWQSVPRLCLVRLKVGGPSYVMTPALADPAHANDPIVVGVGGMVFQWVWNAVRDGYATGSLNGVMFQLAYTDIFCCEEIEGDEEFHSPPVGPPPVQPPPPPPPPIVPPPQPPPLPPPPPPIRPPIIPPIVPPIVGPGGAVPPGLPGTIQDFGSILNSQRVFEPAAVVPTMPPNLGYIGQTVYDPTGRLIDLAPTAIPDTFSFVKVVDTSPPPQPIVVGGGATPAPGIVETGPQGTQITTYDFGTSGLALQGAYQQAMRYLNSFDVLPESVNGLSITAFVPTYALPQTQRSNLYIALTNANSSAVEPVFLMSLAKLADGTVVTLSPATAFVPPTGPPGSVPPGTYAAPVICINWTQFPQGGVSILVMLLGANLLPIAGVLVPAVALPPGTLPQPGWQPTEYLTPSVRAIAGFPAGLAPTYEASVNEVGDEDTFVFVAARADVSIVVQATAEALNAFFEPLFLLYDVNDMSTPIATHDEPFMADGVPIDEGAYSIGWQGALTVGNKYAIVVKHKTQAHFSRRWAFRIFHIETVPATGGIFTNLLGELAGEFSCAYGRQDVALLNDRTGQMIFVHTNEIGVSYDVQQDAIVGSDGVRLAVATGDKIDVLRPGPGVLYRRDQDLIGQATV